MYNVGLQVQEGVAKGYGPLALPSKRNAGILMARLRGPLVPTPIASLEDDRAIYGGYLTDAYGYAVMKNLYRNAGAYTPTITGLRIVGTGSLEAKATLTAGGNTIPVFAAYEGNKDVGSWGNDLSLEFYPANASLVGKYVLNVLYKGKIVNTYNDKKIKSLFEQLASSKFVAVDLAAATITEDTFSKAVGATIKVGVAGDQDDNVSFTVVTPDAGFTAVVDKVGLSLYNSFGTLIGTILTYDGVTNKGTLSSTALVVGDIYAPTYLTDLAYTANLTGGVYNAPTEADFYGKNVDGDKYGMELFAGEDVQVIINTEFFTKAMTVEGNSWSQANDKLYMFNYPETVTSSLVQEYAAVLQTEGVSHSAGYLGWVKTLVDDVNYGFVPMIGCAYGAGYCKATGMQGDYIHIPPAGVDSAFVDIVEVKNGKLSQAEIDNYVQELTTNVVQYQIGLGYFLISSRTNSTNPLYHSIHIRLQTSYYKRVLRENYNWVLQKPSTPELKKEVYGSIRPFFKTEYANGALERSVPFEQACDIIIDARNNPASQSRKLLNMDIDWIPTDATEAFRISMNRNDGQLLINEGNLS